MKINSRQNPQDSIYHDAKTMLGIITTASETVTLPLFEFFRSANEWARQITVWIMQKQGAWKYDDTNYSTFPTATTTLVDSQQDYSLPSSALKIERVEVMDASGNYQILDPVTKEWIKSQAISEFNETDGMPKYYSMEADSIFLYPQPATGFVTMAAGLKIYINRDISTFSLTDTSTQPGFDPTFHRGISIGCALDFANSRNLVNTIPLLVNKLNSFKSDLQEFYSSRQEDIKPTIRLNRESTI